MLKQLAFRLAPRAAIAVSSSRGRRRSHRFVRQWGLFDLNKRLISEIGAQVVAGPFKGMILTSLSHKEHIGPYLLGTYEMELHPWLDELRRHTFGQIVDVGANFGYYGIGLARQCPTVPVVVFDTDWWARMAVRQMARANRTRNVSVKSLCSPSWLDAHLRPGALVFSDCEGYEEQLFCGKPSPAFCSATFLIEVHENFVPGVADKIRRAFAGTHAIREVASREETPLTLRSATLTEAEMQRVATEPRPPQQWLLLEPLTSPPTL